MRQHVRHALPQETQRLFFCYMDVFLKVGDFEVVEHELISVPCFFERRSYFLNPLAACWLHAHAAKKAACCAAVSFPLALRIKSCGSVLSKKAIGA
jgi:hypothetical protein